jgi:sRNA-binding regulator protein Hfq
VAEPKSKSARPPEQTLEEIKYLKRLIEKKTAVCVKLSDNQMVEGVVEYYDQRFIRITRTGAPNLFIFKHDIKYLYEIAPHETAPQDTARHDTRHGEVA